MTASSDRPTRFPMGLTLFTALALALLVGLGEWQVQRLHWKVALLARIAALQNAPAAPIGPSLAKLAASGDVDFTRVTVDCPDIERTPFVRLYAVRDGEAGYRIITPCRLTGAAYPVLLVDRGFLRQDAPKLDIAQGARLTQPLVGVLRKGDKKTFVTPDNQPAQGLFYSRDPAAMAKALGAQMPAPVFLMLETPAPRAGGPVPAPVPPDIPNRHLEYAVTWFGLAAALLGVYLATLWRRLAK